MSKRSGKPDRVSELISEHFVPHEEGQPDITVMRSEELARFNRSDRFGLTLFKIWRHGNLLEKRGRRETFYQEPYWLLVFKVGPIKLGRRLLNSTLSAIISVYKAMEKKDKT
jgi:hypothetical protein